MKSILSFLSGKKTYLVAIVGLVYGFLINDVQIIETSLLAITLRAGIAKVK